MTRHMASELRSLALDGLKAIKSAILITAGAIILVAATWWAAVAVGQLAFNTEILALEVAAVTVLMLLTAAFVWLTFSERRVSQSLQAGRSETAIRTLMVAVFAVASFASLASLLYLEGAITISEPIAREDVIFEFQVVYTWHLFDTVPLLDIPQNLRWELPFEFEDSLGGLLLILFTAIVILPLIRVVRAIWVGYREPYENALRSALQSRKDWKTEEHRGKGGYGRAVVVRTVVESACDEPEERVEPKAPEKREERRRHPKLWERWESWKGKRHEDRKKREERWRREERILVDVMRDVANADAPLKRLGFVADEDTPLNRLVFFPRVLAGTDSLELAGTFDAGYLLVVDAVAERARDRIESAFARSDLPAALAVWRGDQPPADLTRAVEALFDRIDSARQP